MLPCAPARLSMTTCWPHSSASFAPRMRASASVPPPGGNGTMKRTGFSGKRSCAATGKASAQASNHQKRMGKLLIGAAESVEAGRVVDVGDGVVAVHQRPVEQRVLHAAHLVLDLEQLPVILRVGYPLEAPLVLVGFHIDEPALLQPLVGRG